MHVFLAQTLADVVALYSSWKGGEVISELISWLKDGEGENHIRMVQKQDDSKRVGQIFLFSLKPLKGFKSY